MAFMDVEKAKDRPTVGKPNLTETVGFSKWAFDGLGPSSVRSSTSIRSWTE